MHEEPDQGRNLDNTGTGQAAVGLPFPSTFRCSLTVDGKWLYISMVGLQWIFALNKDEFFNCFLLVHFRSFCIYLPQFSPYTSQSLQHQRVTYSENASAAVSTQGLGTPVVVSYSEVMVRGQAHNWLCFSRRFESYSVNARLGQVPYSSSTCVLWACTCVCPVSGSAKLNASASNWPRPGRS